MTQVTDPTPVNALETRMRRSATLIPSLLVALSLVVLPTSSGCTRRTAAPDLEPPARVVDELLRVRSEGETSTAVYERLVESTEVASTLASDSAGRQDRPTPAWEPPRVVKETSKTAEVEVRWKSSDEFEDWPASTVFEVKLVDERWVVVGAKEPTASAEPTSTP